MLFLSDIPPGDALRVLSYLFRRTCRHDASAGIAAARPHIHKVIRIADHIQIMLNDHHGGTVPDQLLEHTQQGLYIQRMQADGGFMNTNTLSACPLPISLASFSRWASPPERLGVSSPRVR